MINRGALCTIAKNMVCSRLISWATDNSPTNLSLIFRGLLHTTKYLWFTWFICGLILFTIKLFKEFLKEVILSMEFFLLLEQQCLINGWLLWDLNFLLLFTLMQFKIQQMKMMIAIRLIKALDLTKINRQKFAGMKHSMTLREYLVYII